ncbi:MAG: homoserine O-acetyltransferase MetX [Magnetovibrionaceae bacterium]
MGLFDGSTAPPPDAFSTAPEGHVVAFDANHSDSLALILDSGTVLDSYQIAFQCWGHLNKERNNAIWVCHALTGDHFAAGIHPSTGKPGWWTEIIGPGKVLDTDRYFVVCSNILGGCMGTTGPKEINKATGVPWGLDFPVITIRDMVRAQVKLLDWFGIDRLFAVIGGSMGGMQALEWAVNYPERLHVCLPIATACLHTAQNIAFHEVGRQAIMADPDWCNGDYLVQGRNPSRGLAVARMAAHITYLSEPALQRKFGRKLQDREAVTFGFDADFQVESYLRHQGSTFVERFDANSYLFITRAMDYFDLAAPFGGQLGKAFQAAKARFCVISFTSDWLYPTAESRRIVTALNSVAAEVSFAEVESDKGHDAFLLDEPTFHRVLQGFLEGSAERFQIGDALSGHLGGLS